MRQKVHHKTERGARIALARKQITQESYEATLRGELSLVQARELGREGGPETRTIRSSSGAATEEPELPQERPGPCAPVSAGVMSQYAARSPGSVLVMMLDSTENSSGTLRTIRSSATSGSLMNERLMPRRGS